MIDNLPPEVRAHILIFLESAEDLITLRSVSRMWLEMTESQELWRNFCQRRHRVFRMELFDNDWRKCFLNLRKTCQYPVNRIVIHALNGNYFTISPDGTESSIREITTDHSESSKYYGQATWSPHGDSIAIAQYRVNSHKSNILLYDVKEQKITERFETPQHPFYFYWSPDSTRLTFLSNWPTHSIAMHYIDIARDPSLKLIGAGRPYYYSFDPTGAPRVVSHFALGYMEIINLETLARKDVMHSFSLSSFSTPYWLTDREILYVYRCPRGDGEISLKTRLVLATIEEPLTRDQLMKMTSEELQAMMKAKELNVNSEDDLVERVYTQIVEKTHLCREQILAEIDIEDTEVDFVSSPNSNFVAFSDGALYLIDLQRFKASPKDCKPMIIHRFAVAFFWSPNSRYLLFISQERVDIFSHHYVWWIYDTESKEPAYQLTSFSASAEFRQHYLPFYCQYAQSLTFFSPDSRFFVYVNDKSVNICGVQRDSTPRYLCAGTFATWSPC